MGSRNLNTKLLLCKKLTRTKIIEYIRLSTDQLIEKLGLDINKYPVCGCNRFILKELLPKNIKSSPIQYFKVNNG